jgi:asparagine synthase (glutamine-hydrolysing)
MCGILGIYTPEGISRYREELQAANDLVRYRGPDGTGFALFNTRDPDKNKGFVSSISRDGADMDHADLALAHRRLAIIDLSPAGLQPMATEDRTVWITYNGEIYNYIELRKELESYGHAFATHTDTEVILHAYKQWGQDCVHRFNGMWAFAIVDLPNRKIFCSRDRFGIKPFHYYHDGKHFVFASEIKQLLLFPFVPKRPNERMIYDYLAFQAVEHSKDTFYSDICNLPAGNNLIFDLEKNMPEVYRYYEPLYTVNEKITLDEAVLEFHRLLKDSIHLRLRSDVKVGSCLSGGLDSSSIVCIINEMLRDQDKSEIQNTFSSHFDEKEANELEYMNEVIMATNVKAHFIHPSAQDLLEDLESLIWHQEEPFGSTSIYAQWCVFKLVNLHGVKVMLDGQGADELLGGYVPFSTSMYLQELLLRRKLISFMREASRFNIPMRDPLLTVARQQISNTLRKSPHIHGIIQSIRSMKAESGTRQDWLRSSLVKKFDDESAYIANRDKLMFEKHEYLNNYLYRLTFWNNLQGLLKYEDRNSMAFSVEGRVPFLDYRLVDFLFSLPSSFKMQSGFSKYVLRDGLKGILPEKIRLRTTKLGFSTPESLWQKTQLMPLIQQSLNDQKLDTYIDPQKARIHLERLQTSNQRDFSPWRWLNLSLWMRTFDLGPQHS